MTSVRRLESGGAAAASVMTLVALPRAKFICLTRCSSPVAAELKMPMRKEGKGLRWPERWSGSSKSMAPPLLLDWPLDGETCGPVELLAPMSSSPSLDLKKSCPKEAVPRNAARRSASVSAWL
eukprot:11958596-Alexandrium_andersonii.AAC.1